MVKIVVCVLGDNWYYDHALTEIEEGKLIDEVGALSPTLPSTNQSALSEYKDKKLVSLLQMSKVSKVVDENGGPSECICELEATLWSLTWSMSGTVAICRGTHRRG